MNDKLQTTLMRRRRKGFLRSLLIIMEEFFSSQVAQLINGKNPRESWHFWPKMDLFSERIFMTVNLLKWTLESQKNSCWWKTSVFRSGRYWFFTGQMDSSFPNHRKSEEFLLLPLLSNQRQFLKTMISHMGNYLTKAEKFQFRHSTWDFLIS